MEMIRGNTNTAFKISQKSFQITGLNRKKEEK
jgi:hypothetical protein